MNMFIIIIGHVLHKVKFLLLYFNTKRRRSVFRQWSVKAHIISEMRSMFGTYESWFLYYMTENHEDFYLMTRMTPDDFKSLHNLVSPRLIALKFKHFKFKSDWNWRAYKLKCTLFNVQKGGKPTEHPDCNSQPLNLLISVNTNQNPITILINTHY